MPYKIWTVRDQDLWQIARQGLTEDPLALDPDNYLKDNSWFYITEFSHRPEWNHDQYATGCRFSTVKRSDAKSLFNSLVRFWTGRHHALRGTVAIGISRSGTVQVWTIQQSENQRERTLEHLNTNTSGAVFIRGHEDDDFYVAYNVLDSWKDSQKGQMYDFIREAETEGMTPARADAVRDGLMEVEARLNAKAVRTGLSSVNQDRPVNVLDLHHQRASNVVMILEQQLLERFAAIRANTSLPQKLTIISGRGNGSREFLQSTVKSAVKAYLDSHYRGKYKTASRGGAFVLSAADYALPDLTQAMSRL